MSDFTEFGSYPIEQPLEAGNSLRCFVSGFQLRVARIIAPEGQLVGYGEASSIDVALADAAENFHTGESYGRQYRDDDARYQHQVHGGENPTTEIDAHLLQGGKLLAHWAAGQLIAELHTIKDLPDMTHVDAAIEAGGLPTTVTQFGRSFLIDGSRSYQTIYPLSIHEGSTDSYLPVARIGQGKTLTEAIAAALVADEVEVPTAASPF